MVNIKRSYELMKKVSWQGDPCAPQFLLWEGLKCSYPNADSPMITSLYALFVHLKLHFVWGFPKF